MPRLPAGPALRGAARVARQLGLPEGKHLLLLRAEIFQAPSGFRRSIGPSSSATAEAEARGCRSSCGRGSRSSCAGASSSRSCAASKIRFVPPLGAPQVPAVRRRRRRVLDPFHFRGCNSSCALSARRFPVVTSAFASSPAGYASACTGKSILRLLQIAPARPNELRGKSR